MKKLVVMLALIAASVSFASAQGRFSVGPEVAIPMGDFGDAVGVGIGGSLRYEAPINDNLSWTGTVGFISFSKKSFDDGFGDEYDYSASIIPIQAGIKYYFTESFNGFYVGAEAGLNLVKVKVSYLDASATESDTKFGFAPQIGYHIASIDIAARYQVIADADYLGFRIAYVFGGK